MTVEKQPQCVSAQVTELVKSFVEGGEQVTDVGAELSFILPSSSTSSFPALFDSLESKQVKTEPVYKPEALQCIVYNLA